ncbi:MULTISPECIES: hypothetical protein [Sphingobacterium]|uniref:hypothetical protein n=1 Tax=Sphingobacterium TaxID=28453 RepID=UPI00257CE241|nr:MULTISPECIES: hypothetical protein [Sphingobacterium]
MKINFCVPFLIAFIVFGCSKNNSEQIESEKLYSEWLTFSTIGNVTYYEVINVDTKKRIAYGENPKFIREELDKIDLAHFRRTYKEVIKVKPGEKLRLILPYYEKRRNIAIYGSNISSRSGINSRFMDKIQFLDFNMATKLYD